MNRMHRCFSGLRIFFTASLALSLLASGCAKRSAMGKGETVREGRVVEGDLREETPGDAELRYGFRIQLYATRDEDKARKVAESARKLFDERTYIEFQDPLYKVRLGDFPTREEAEKVRYRVSSSGFEDAWIVETTIRMGDVPREGGGR